MDVDDRVLGSPAAARLYGLGQRLARSRPIYFFFLGFFVSLRIPFPFAIALAPSRVSRLTRLACGQDSRSHELNLGHIKMLARVRTGPSRPEAGVERACWPSSGDGLEDADGRSMLRRA